MLIALVAAVIAVVVGITRGGSLERLARTRFSWSWVLFAGLILQVGFQIGAPKGLRGSTDLWLTLASIAAVLFFLVANRNLPGTLVASVGLGMNALVIAVNGAMPVSRAAARVAGIDPGSFATPGIKHELLDAGTRLPWLADVLALPRLQTIFSIGDVVLGAGLAILAYRCTVAAETDVGPRTRPVSG